MENKELTIMEQFLIDEINMICECCYDEVHELDEETAKEAFDSFKNSLDKEIY